MASSNFKNPQTRQPSMASVRYRMLIQWSDEDRVFVVTLPEFENAHTHGETYEKAARQGRLLIESFIMWYHQDGKALPEPSKFDIGVTA